MADTTQGHARRPDEPQCYNCGTLGHWAIACPEPTRAVPAGLEAWKNTSTTEQKGQGGQGHGRDHRGQRKSKGPVITRYAPPGPASGYPPHSGHYGGQASYPQAPSYPLPSYPPAASQYPPAYHQIPPHPPQSSSPGSYGSSVYSPPPHTPAQPSPPPRPSYASSRPGPPPPLPHHPLPPHQPPPHQSPPPPQPFSSAYASGYNPYPQSTPQPPFPVSAPPRPSYPSTLPGPPPIPSPVPLSLPRPPASRPQRPPHASHPKKSPSLSQVSSKHHVPGSGPGPTERLAHGLPPKPPVPIRDRPEGRFDNRNKKKQEHQKASHEGQRKDQPGNTRPPNQNQKQQRHGSNSSYHGKRASVDASPRQSSNAGSKVEERPENLENVSPARQNAEVADSTTGPENAQGDGQAPQKADHEKHDFKLDPKTAPGSPEKRRDSDEVGRTSKGTSNDEVPLPGRSDATGLNLDFPGSGYTEKHVKPVHETEHRESVGLDPALPRGELSSNGDASQLARPKMVNDAREDVRPGEMRSKEPMNGSRDSKSGDGYHDGNPKRKRPESPRARISSHNHRPPLGDKGSQPDERGRSASPRAREQFAGREERSESRRSSISSASSRSSGLDSLERELLGKETRDARHSESGRSRTDAEDTPRHKKRRVQVDSAYSRRW